MTELQRRPDTGLTAAHVDETIVEPARRGIRKFGAGLGTVALGAATAAGVGSATFGAILMTLTTGFFFGVGAVFLAGGVTAIGFGGLGILGIRRADRRADDRQLERRFLKLLQSEVRLRDQIAARRTGSDVAAVRALANRLVREGVVLVDVDPETGEDVYELDRAEQLSGPSLTAAEAAEMRGFDARLEEDRGPIRATAEVPEEVAAEVEEV